MTYLWYTGDFNLYSTEEKMMVDKMTTMWTSFAKLT